MPFGQHQYIYMGLAGHIFGHAMLDVRHPLLFPVQWQVFSIWVTHAQARLCSFVCVEWRLCVSVAC